MNWTVIWLDPPLNEIARAVALAWGTPESEVITRAMARIELLLERDPANAGESRAGHGRILFDRPLTIEFEVHDDARTVVVTRARYNPAPGSP
ncbi:MAG: hypothetical protein C0501_31760 [Isosphaera sp.]|nr:hypothetical protein [Isosphaera sp.]